MSLRRDKLWRYIAPEMLTTCAVPSVLMPQAEQDAIASQILAPLADEEAWRRRFAEKRDIIHRLAREALEQDASCESLPLDDLLDE
jgi:hypothetical protein